MKFPGLKMLVGATALGALTTGGAMAADVEVMHWWTSGGENAAVSVFADEFEKGGDKWIDTATAGGQNSRAATMQRILGGDPPGAAQFNPGRQYEELIEGGLLLDLTDLATKEGWADVVRPAQVLTGACMKDGKVWCVPVNIHSWQWAWASIPVFEQAGVPMPKNFDEILAAMPKLKEAGFIPFAVGGEAWQNAGAFNVMLLNTLGKDGWMRLYKDRDVAYAKGPEVRKVMENWRKLASFKDEGSANRNWNDTTNLVLTDKAGLQIMGDWAHGEFAVAGKVAGKDYECIQGPSETPYLTTGGDIFLFPKNSDPDVEAAQLRMASMMIRPDVQVRFNLAKGSLPVRGDVDMSAVDTCMRKGLETLKNPDSVVPDVQRLLTEDSTGQLNDLWVEFAFNGSLSVDDAQARFASIIENAR